MQRRATATLHLRLDSPVLTNLEPIMKLAPFAALLISAAAAVPAFASGDDAATVNNGPKTRAEVKAELAQARANGELSMNPNDPAYPAQFATGGYTGPRVPINTVRTSVPGDSSLNRPTVPHRRAGARCRTPRQTHRHSQADTRNDPHPKPAQNTRTPPSASEK